MGESGLKLWLVERRDLPDCTDPNIGRFVDEPASGVFAAPTSLAAAASGREWIGYDTGELLVTYLGEASPELEPGLVLGALV